MPRKRKIEVDNDEFKVDNDENQPPLRRSKRAKKPFFHQTLDTPPSFHPTRFMVYYVIL